MYIPKINLETDQDKIVSFMQQFSFAPIITAKNRVPIATHLPLLVNNTGQQITLTSHFAKANNQWNDIENSENLVIFSEPHAYISTKNYEKKLEVPTWNYISVHAYGEGKLITDPDNVFKILEATIDNYEPSYRDQWDNFPEDYKIKMSKGIIAFEIHVTKTEAKKKLSQNKSKVEKDRIIESLSKSKKTNEQLIAKYMEDIE